ncbi:MAG: hypothetical protein JEZ14_25290 [Marinilabiliaceae bacterium]|nr:hypothetical protein [Marinilabiliaceae bacterium]
MHAVSTIYRPVFIVDNWLEQVDMINVVVESTHVYVARIVRCVDISLVTVDNALGQAETRALNSQIRVT